MGLQVNSFESGTNGAAVGTSGFGNASGWGWDSVTISAGSTMTYDNSHAHSGSLSCNIQTTSAVTCYVMWQSSQSLTGGTQLWFRLYLYQTAFPSSQHQLFEALTGGNRCADVVLLTSGKLIMRNNSGSTIFTSTNTVPNNQWYRIEGFVISDASVGQVELKLYNSADSNTATETQTSAANQNTLGGSIQQARFGLASGGSAGLDWWQDDCAVSSTDYIGPGAIPIMMTAGASTQASFTVITKPTGGTSARLKVATDVGLTQNIQYIGAQTPDSYGYVKHVVSGLSSGTQYYYQLADTPNGGIERLVGNVGQCKTLPPAGIPANFRVALASCINTSLAVASPNVAIDDWVTWNADLNVFTGDLDYEDPSPTDVPSQIALFEKQILQYGGSQANMMAKAWGYYCRSDHDSTNADNGDSNNAWTAANLLAVQEIFPLGTLGDSGNSPVHGLYQTWVCGRVRFIMIDIRNIDRSPGAAADDSSKTMLGATQLAWLKTQLTQPEPLKIIVADTAWMGNYLASDLDKWWAYNTERQAILSYIAANMAQVRNVMFWHGDDHCVAVATPAKNTWGNFSVYCAAPLRQTGAAIPNVAATFSSYYNNAGGDCRQYGRITFTDDGTFITVNFSGWDALNTVERVSQTDKYAAAGTGFMSFAV